MDGEHMLKIRFVLILIQPVKARMWALALSATCKKEDDGKLQEHATIFTEPDLKSSYH